MVKKEVKTVKTRKIFVDMLVFEIFLILPHSLCVSVSWTLSQSLASPSPSQMVSGHPRGPQLASDQHDVPSHPHTDPGDITTLAVQVAQHLNEDMNDVFRIFVHCEPRYERSFDQT